MSAIALLTSRDTPARRRPTQMRARLTVEAVLDASVKLLKRDGADAITTNRVAEVAGVSIGSVYQYFPDKHAIFEALQDRHAAEVRRLVHDTLAAQASASLEALLVTLVVALVDAHARDPELHAFLGRQIRHRADGAEGLRGALRQIISSRAHELAASHDLEKVLFVVPNLIDVLAHEAVLCRPPHLSLAVAREEAARSVSLYLQARA